MYLVFASGGKTAPAFWPFLKTHIFYPSHAHRTSLGWGVGMLTFMLTCVTCTSYVTSLGWGGWGCKRSCQLASHAHLTLRHWVGGVGMLTFMLTCVTCTSDVASLDWGVGMLTFMLTCVTCTSFVTSLGWGGGCTFDVTSLGWGCVLCKETNQKENYSDSHRWCRCDVATNKVRHTMQSQLDQIQRPC